MSSHKKLTFKVALWQMFICLRPPPPQFNIPHPLPATLCTLTQGGGRGKELNQREGNSSQSWVENTIMTDCISSLITLINTYRKASLQVNVFR